MPSIDTGPPVQIPRTQVPSADLREEATASSLSGFGRYILRCAASGGRDDRQGLAVQVLDGAVRIVEVAGCGRVQRGDERRGGGGRTVAGLPGQRERGR